MKQENPFEGFKDVKRLANLVEETHRAMRQAYGDQYVATIFPYVTLLKLRMNDEKISATEAMLKATSETEKERNFHDFAMYIAAFVEIINNEIIQKNKHKFFNLN